MWNGLGGSCLAAGCQPTINGRFIDTGTDGWPQVISWSTATPWYGASVHGSIANLSQGQVSVQWVCLSDPSAAPCTATLDCKRFGVTLTGPY